MPPGTGSIQVGTLPGCPNSGLPTLLISSEFGCAFPTETTSSSGTETGSSTGSSSSSSTGSSSGSSGDGGTHGGTGAASGGRNSTSGSGSSKESGHDGENAGPSWLAPPPTFTQESYAPVVHAATAAQGFAGVNTSGVCTQFRGQRIASVQFACPEFARQPGPTATSVSSSGEGLRIQGSVWWHGAMWWTLICVYAVSELLGGG